MFIIPGAAQPRTQLPDKLLCSTKNLKAVGGRTPRTAPHGDTKDSQFLRYHSFCLFLAKTAATKLQWRAVACSGVQWHALSCNAMYCHVRLYENKSAQSFQNYSLQFYTT